MALLGGSILALVIRLPRSRWSTQGRIVLLTLVTAVGLVSCFGYDRVVTRLGTFQEGLMSRGGRLAIWSRALPLVRNFPLWGSGYGTYQFVDVLHRSDALDAGMIVDHAHNDYLEALVEGGLALFLPVVVAMVLVFRLGFGAVRRHEDRPIGGLVLGALLAFTVVAIHSFSDFGMHIPANAVIVTVLCAQLCAVGRQRGGPDRRPRLTASPTTRIDTSCGFGGWLRSLGPWRRRPSGSRSGEGWRADRAQQLRLTAFDLDASPDPAVREQKVAALEAATRLVPGYARLQAELAHAHLTILELRMEELTGSAPRAAVAGPGPIAPRDGRGETDQERFTQLHLGRALRHFLRSRDVCPLRAEAHMEIAEYVDKFEKAEPRETYLERAKFLAPDDPDLWERCGTTAVRRPAGRDLPGIELPHLCDMIRACSHSCRCLYTGEENRHGRVHRVL